MALPVGVTQLGTFKGAAGVNGINGAKGDKGDKGDPGDVHATAEFLAARDAALAARDQAEVFSATAETLQLGAVRTLAGVELWKTGAAYTVGQRVMMPNGDVKVSLTNHTSGGAPGTLNWGDPPALTTEVTARKRDLTRQRRLVERQHPHGPGLYTIPATFGWDPGVPIVFDGWNYSTPFDVAVRKNAGTVKRYVETNLGTALNNSKSGTLARLTATLVAGVSVTSLPVTAMADSLLAGAAVTVLLDREHHTFITSEAVSAGATAVPVTASTLTSTLPAGASVIAPMQSLLSAVNACNDGDEVVIVNGGTVPRVRGMNGTAISKSINIIGLNGPTFTTGDFLSWSLASGRSSTYQAARTNVRKLVDFGLSPEGVEYTRVGSVDLVEATPASWYQAANGTGDLYVHTAMGEAPNPQEIIGLLTTKGLEVNPAGRTSAQTFYMEGVRVVGGNDGALELVSQIAHLLNVALKDVDVLHGGYGPLGATAATLGNGLRVLGNVVLYSQRTRVAYACLDGFNYHASSGYIPKAVEIDCEAHDCGTGQIPQAAGVGASQNASTTHDGALVLRIGGRYHHTYGTPVADVHVGTKSINLSCYSWDSTAPAGAFNAGFAAQQAGTEMWVLGCLTWGTTSDLYCVTDSTMHVGSLTEYDTVTGGGTFDYVLAA